MSLVAPSWSDYGNTSRLCSSKVVSTFQAVLRNLTYICRYNVSENGLFLVLSNIRISTTVHYWYQVWRHWYSCLFVKHLCILFSSVWPYVVIVYVRPSVEFIVFYLDLKSVITFCIELNWIDETNEKLSYNSAFTPQLYVTVSFSLLFWFYRVKL